jgi:hypothetical protein
MAKREYVVRVVYNEDFIMDKSTFGDGAFIECLRYAGVVTKHESSTSTACFDIHCPKGLDSKNWSEQNARRMQSFGINAVSAPFASNPTACLE